MRTNIQLNDDLLAEARKYAAGRSKRAVVHEALAAYVAAKNEERRRVSYRDRLERLREKTKTVRVRSDSRDLVRADRSGR